MMKNCDFDIKVVCRVHAWGSRNHSCHMRKEEMGHFELRVNLVLISPAAQTLTQIQFYVRVPIDQKNDIHTLSEQ